MFETNLISVALKCEHLKTKAELVYWNVPSADYHRKNMHTDFTDLAKMLGYVVIAQAQTEVEATDDTP